MQQSSGMLRYLASVGKTAAVMPS